MKILRKKDDKEVVCFLDEKIGELFFSNDKKRSYYYIKTGKSIYCWEKIEND